jgi:hypothetical protein
MIVTLGNATAAGTNALYGLDMRLATSTLGGDKNLSFTAYGMQSVTDSPVTGRESGNAFGVDLSYPNDLFFGRTGFIQIDNDFTAGIGFVPRKGIREFYLNAGAGPRPGRLGILQITSEFSLDHIAGLNGLLQTRKIMLIPLQVRFITGEELKADITYSHESLAQDFNLLGRTIIPAGEYDFSTYSVKLGSAKQRNLWGTFGYEWGEFYNGQNSSLVFTAGWQAFVNLFLSAEMEKSYLSFPGNNFDVGIYRGIVNILFSRQVNMFTFVQYDDVSETVGWQSRFRWIIRPGREVLVAWNSSLTDPMERFAISDSSLRLKLKYNMRF